MVWRALLLPVLLGMLVGYLGVAVILHLGQRVAAAESNALPAASSEPPAATRLVVLLLNGSGEDVVGVWQLWSDLPGSSGKAACVVSPESRVPPSNRTIGELLRLAMATGDDSWVARNTQDFSGDCVADQASAEDQVIFASQGAMIEIVDAFGGIELEQREMNGVEAWNYMVSPPAVPAELQRRQKAIWVALHAAVKEEERSVCQRVTDSRKLFRSFPDCEDPCRQFETLLLQTPVFIAKP